MIVTYKIKHCKYFDQELAKAKQVAEFAVSHKGEKLTSAHTKQFGLQSAIANQIIRKYGNNKKIKRVNKVNLIIPAQSIQHNNTEHKIIIPCLKYEFTYWLGLNFEKINQIEIGKEYLYMSVTILEKEEVVTPNYIGVDRNTTGHIAVVANPITGKILKLGKSALYVHNKYKNIRRKLQAKGKFSLLKKIKHRESDIVKNINHNISKKIVKEAQLANANIVLENLKGIRKQRKKSKSFNNALSSWSFYQLQTFVEYKAKLQGVKVIYVDPAYTSQVCSRCGLIGERKGKLFKCECSHVDHADVNAAFNIASLGSIGKFNIDRDVLKGRTDTPREAMV